MQQSEYKLLTSEYNDNIEKLIIESFSQHNQIFKIFSIDKSEAEIYQRNVNLQKILEEKLSYGAFIDNQLVSICLMCNLNTNFQKENERHTTPKLDYYMQELSELLIYDRMTLSKQNKKCAFLYIIATDPSYYKQHLATQCLIKAIQKVKENGYEYIYVEAGHIGTLKIIEKLFKDKFQIHNKIMEIEDKPCILFQITCKL